jgi:Ca2+-binding RTX toxin-like protein
MLAWRIRKKAGGTTVNRIRWAAAAIAALVALSLSLVASAQSDSLPTISPANLDLQAPAVQVGDLTVLGPSEATAATTIDTNGLATDVFVEYGTNGVLNQRTPKVSLAAGADTQNVLVKLLGLDPGSIITYRVVAENSAGTTTSTNQTFSTPANGSGSSAVVLVDLRSGNAVSGASALGKKTARCTIVGNARANTLRGTSKRDVICGLGGNDRIRGRGGSDVLIGGPGRDTVNGNGGRDRLYGNGGNDKLISRDQKIGELLNGGSGRDRATADRGDRLFSVEKPVRLAVHRR